MRWLAVASVAGIFGLAAGSDAISRGIASVAGKRACAPYSVQARIAGRAVCLRDTQKCAPRLARQYGRYGFACQSGSLVATWKRLSRTLHFPTLPHGAACPISPVASDVDFRAHNVGNGIGPGPIFPAPFSPDAPQPLDDFSVPVGWRGGKHAFFTLATYRGRVLIRGRQLDGPGVVTFASNEIRGAPTLADPKPSLRLNVGTPQLVHTFFFLTPPGCYGYQIDGTTFSHVVVFKVSLSS